jgi:hypothetical protein
VADTKPCDPLSGLETLAGKGEHAHESACEWGPDFLVGDVADNRADGNGLAAGRGTSDGTGGLKDACAGADDQALGHVEMLALVACDIDERLHVWPPRLLPQWVSAGVT